jgi:radical SAM superfamily enzyme YgiQ (UPF0313 family)
MTSEYYIVHDPLTFDLMDLHGKSFSPLDILAFLTNRDPSDMNESNFLEFLKFELGLQRKGSIEIFGMENYGTQYIANQIAKLRPGYRVILADGKRRRLDRIIEQEGQPKSVFITAMSSNFPTAVATAIPLNHARIPVVIGGIHVSTSPNDIHFIKKNAPYPELISQVRGAGDSTTLKEVLENLEGSFLKPDYVGYRTVEDGVWGEESILAMEPRKMEFLGRIPVFGSFLRDNYRINPIVPYLGCPYSCSFCSISTLPENQRRLQSRSPEDFIAELRTYQENGVNLTNRFFFFLPDNLLLGGKHLDKILDGIIDSNLKIDYSAQISIEVANRDSLLEKLRRSGATHFFIGLESLDLRNLEAIGKNTVKDIKRKNLSVRDYYSQQIKKIQSYGISIHGAFILGLPYDYFHSLADHTGIEIANFCLENHIGLQPCSLTDLPGSRDFKESHENGNYIYGKQGTMDYLLSLCISDLTETNRVPSDSLSKSPLIVLHMAYDAVQRVCSTRKAIGNALYMALKSWQFPTKNGKISSKERFLDSLCSFASQLIVSQYRDLGDALVYSNQYVRGSYERLYDMEQNSDLRKVFHDFVERFK